MNEAREISMKEMLEMTAAELEQIEVPVRYADSISRPIYIAVRNLHSCISAMEAQAEEPAEQEGEQDGEGQGV